MSITEVNYFSVLAAALIFMLIGAIWYHPKVFGTLWMREMGLSQDNLTCATSTFIGAAINALVVAFVLSLFIHHVGADNGMSGASVGFWAWAGFSITTNFSAVLWEKKPLKIFLINTSCLFISYILMGALLATWS